MPSALEKAPAKKEAYRWKATTPVMQQKEVVATPKALKKALEHEKNAGTGGEASGRSH
ncbi:DNA polymerase III subunits gamma and tau [Escherichia coli]|uniref:DNA polymerase III subunits gamma and tau n=1 Tax=Escherichia coli TaxID=562 RepID=A0A2X1N348_ECOLX|nr:DNA polymerase III subunits gamma and tau [Escherichia coli]